MTNLNYIIYLVLSSKDTFGSLPNLPSLPGATTHNTLMHGSLNTIVHFNVKLGKGVISVSRGLADITKTGSVDNVAHNESLDGLILWDCLSGGGTPDTLYVAPSVLITSVIAPLDSHFCLLQKKNGR